MKPMILTVPAQADWALVVRMAAAGAGALFDLPVDVLEDLRTALDESFDLLLHQDYCAETITLCCEARSDGLHVSLTAQERTEQPCPDAADADIAQLIIGTLVREVNLEQDAQGVLCVRMTLPARG